VETWRKHGENLAKFPKPGENMVKFPKPGENLVKLIEEAFDMFKYIYFCESYPLGGEIEGEI
jgi:hypothetical protein